MQLCILLAKITFLFDSLIGPVTTYIHFLNGNEQNYFKYYILKKSAHLLTEFYSWRTSPNVTEAAIAGISEVASVPTLKWRRQSRYTETDAVEQTPVCGRNREKRCQMLRIFTRRDSSHKRNAFKSRDIKW